MQTDDKLKLQQHEVCCQVARLPQVTNATYEHSTSLSQG